MKYVRSVLLLKIVWVRDRVYFLFVSFGCFFWRGFGKINEEMTQNYERYTFISQWIFFVSLPTIGIVLTSDTFRLMEAVGSEIKSDISSQAVHVALKNKTWKESTCTLVRPSEIVILFPLCDNIFSWVSHDYNLRRWNEVGSEINHLKNKQEKTKIAGSQISFNKSFIS